ncbi:MAG TPA: tol-pal system protein YbgF [Polyangiaceae bacterium]|jgi:tol-pal system protein YbgF
MSPVPPFSLAAWTAIAAVIAGSGVGCARNAEDKQLDAMRAEMDKAREAQDSADPPPTRPVSSGPELVVPESYTAPPATPPPPPVVQLGDDPAGDEAAEADPQDTTPRPSIRVFGSVRSRGRGGDDQVEESNPDDRSPAAPSSSLPPEAKRAYDADMALVTAKRYDQALDAFAAFLVKWPDHPYADNAMFWRGECYFAKGDFTRATEQFEGVLRRFPASEKAPDALLRLGMAHDKLGHSAKAKESYDRLAQQFPDSDAARRIPAARASGTPAGPAPEEHR